MSRIPNLFIVGAPKCGTTAMWSYLGKHPDIFAAGKEYHFFGSDLAYRNQQRPDSQGYLAYFGQATDERYVLDASIGYLASKRAAGEIASYSPDSRIIAILRNPIDMMHSLHSELLFQGDEDVDDFAEALSLEEARQRGERIPEACQSIWALFYREVAHYSEQLIRYFDAVGRDRVHVVVFDDLKDDTAGSYRGLGIPRYRSDLPARPSRGERQQGRSEREDGEAAAVSASHRSPSRSDGRAQPECPTFPRRSSPIPQCRQTTPPADGCRSAPVARERVPLRGGNARRAPRARPEQLVLARDPADVS